MGDGRACNEGAAIPVKPEAPHVPELGEVLAGKYRLLSVLGRGGMGVVFEAQHELLNFKVALKVLGPDVLRNKEAVTRFFNEARAVARIASDRVVRVLDLGFLDDGLPFMVMERLEGLDLGDLLQQQGALPIAEAVDLVIEALEGVSQAHLEGIVHRDLKPSNLFLARAADGTQAVKILDFGISKMTSQEGNGRLTATSAVLGSPLYMSPEQLRSSKSTDARADLWSMGVITYELLTGTVPYVGDNVVEIFAAIQETEPQPAHAVRPAVPSPLSAIIARCLRRKPAERYADAYALASALLRFGSARSRRALERMERQFAGRGMDLPPSSATSPAGITPVLAPDTTAAIDETTSDRGSAPMRAQRHVIPVGAAASSAPWSTTHPQHRKRRRAGPIALVVGTGLALVVAFAIGFGVRNRSAGAPGVAGATASPVADGALVAMGSASSAASTGAAASVDLAADAQAVPAFLPFPAPAPSPPAPAAHRGPSGPAPANHPAAAKENPLQMKPF